MILIALQVFEPALLAVEPEVFEPVASAGYVAFHDVPAEVRGRQFNLDHVVVGPAGVFVVETKTRVRRAAKHPQPEHEVAFDGETLRFPWCEDRNALKQVLANTDWLKGVLRDFGGERLMFHPVIVVPGWYVRTTVGNSEVKAMNAEYLVRHFIVPAKRVYTPEELRPVVAWLGDRCRTLEL